MDHLLATVDEVHVMTSLTGFEAMLRSKHVVTYGQPFYAGWGLTEDRCPPPRRTRKLHLSELIAGALIKYPMYLSPQTNRPCEAEHLIDALRAGAKNERRSLSEKILGRLSAWPLWAKYVAK
jgi:capsular polysaccharide export protein